MRHTVRLLTLALLCTTPLSATAHDYELGAIRIDHPWTRATPPGANVAGGYMGLANGGEPDRLLGGSSTVAERVEVHSMEMEGDVMHMRELPDGLELPAGDTVDLAPGGFHLMLIGLREPLRQGERVPVTLQFETAGTVEVELAVDAMGARAPGGEHAGH